MLLGNIFGYLGTDIAPLSSWADIGTGIVDKLGTLSVIFIQDYWHSCVIGICATAAAWYIVEHEHFDFSLDKWKDFLEEQKSFRKYNLPLFAILSCVGYTLFNWATPIAVGIFVCFAVVGYIVLKKDIAVHIFF